MQEFRTESELDDEKICPECKGLIIYDKNEIVCSKCGLVISSLCFSSSYIMSNNRNQDANNSIQYVSLGNTIDNICAMGSFIDYAHGINLHDWNRKNLSSHNQQLFRKLRTNYAFQTRIKNHETEYRILMILNKISTILKLNSHVKNRAAYFYKCIKKQTKIIRNHVSLIGFCIFYASRENSNHAPIGLHEICLSFYLSGHRVTPKLIIRDSIEYQHIIKHKNKPHQSEDFINRFINAIIFSPEVRQNMKKKASNWTLIKYRQLLEIKSQEILNHMDIRKRGARNPFILAAAIVYCADRMLARDFSTKSILTQQIAAKAMDIPEYSIRDHYVKILKPLFHL